ncbi:MAG: tRNA pseudouridine(54/55) synthase Pus10 [Methanomassiliicoccales archaeon]|jgi:tRNA pseudouridine synthase 10|nr:tRNA pseudouridine(54/55) synthase Pus10 [Methanomassiliicoccales archaeon]
MQDLISKAEIALKKDLCDHCLGRIFAQIGTGLTNKQRGESLRLGVTLKRVLQGEPLPLHEKCWVCEGLFNSVERFADAVVAKLSTLEYNTFLIGSKIDPEILEREERLWGEVGGDYAESIKSELNREIGKIVEAKTGKCVDFSHPDVVAVVDTRFASVELEIAPLFIYGRYRKYSREIPQTRWVCTVCKGRGCKRCNFKGKMYETSVQEIIGEPLMRAANGVDHFFHGMGREDIDVRMLGNGRPFVIEIREPKKRMLDLRSLEKTINELGKGIVEVSALRPSSRSEVKKIKSATPEKIYRAEILLNGKVNKEKINEVLQIFKNTRITQQTPTRVAHRRPDKTREKKIVSITIEKIDDDSITLVIRAEAGTYIKEFVHGDGGRTKPSLSDLLGVPCEVKSLDVIEVADNTGEE